MLIFLPLFILISLCGTAQHHPTFLLDLVSNCRKSGFNAMDVREEGKTVIMDQAEVNMSPSFAARATPKWKKIVSLCILLDNDNKI